jgi:hypothetical protein
MIRTLLAALALLVACKGSSSNPSVTTNLALGRATGAAFADLSPAPKPSGTPTPIAALSRGASAPIRGFGGTTATGVTVAFAVSKEPAYQRLHEIFLKARVFDLIAEGLNRTIRIPKNIQIQMTTCNAVNAYYDPSTNNVIICDELVSHFIESLRGKFKTDDDLGTAVIGATTFVLFHEIGHGLIDVLSLPAVGREEDSVDQLATLILVAAGEDGINMALAGASWFQTQGDQQDANKLPFWDEHSIDKVRYYNILCLLYGENPQRYAQLVVANQLPEERAQRCPDEYRKINGAWEKLIQPYLTSAAAANVDYTPGSAAPSSSSSAPQNPSPSATPTAGTPSVPVPPTAGSPDPDDRDLGSEDIVDPDEAGADVDAHRPPAVAGSDTGGPPCDAVSDKLADLIARSATQQAAGDAKVAAELERQLQTQLPAVKQQLLASCQHEQWSAQQKTCLASAATLTDADRCAK